MLLDAGVSGGGQIKHILIGYSHCYTFLFLSLVCTKCNSTHEHHDLLLWRTCHLEAYSYYNLFVVGIRNKTLHDYPVTNGGSVLNDLYKA